MKKTYLFLLTFLFGLTIGTTSCSDDDNAPVQQPGTENSKPGQQEQGVITLNDQSQAKNLYKLLKKVDADTQCNQLNSGIEITDDHYQEIKRFTDEITAGSRNDSIKYIRIFKWVTEHITYARGVVVPQDPYSVFKNKTAVCQGYADLTCVMLNTQGIPCLSVNGMMPNIGAHAWLYCYLKGSVKNRWFVSDPTNKRHHEARRLQEYEKSLVPYMAHITFEQDDVKCNFNNATFNLCGITSQQASFTVPTDIAGFTISCFIPNEPLPSTLSEINIGNHIIDFGSKEQGSMSLHNFGTSLKSIIVGAENPVLETYGGAVYKKGENKPYCIPTMAEEIRLRPMTVLEKNTLVDMPNLKVVYVAEGTQKIEGWAIENTPALKEIHLPKGLTYPDNAFPKGVQIIQ